MTYLNFIIGVAVCCLLGMFWFIKGNIKERPKSTIIITMAVLIFLITGATIIKTYRDYTSYISNAQGVIISNVAFAIFLDFSVLIIGGLFLYLANQMYLADQADQFAQGKITDAKKQAAEIIKDAKSSPKSK